MDSKSSFIFLIRLQIDVTDRQSPMSRLVKRTSFPQICVSPALRSDASRVKMPIKRRDAHFCSETNQSTPQRSFAQSKRRPAAAGMLDADIDRIWVIALGRVDRAFDQRLGELAKIGASIAKSALTHRGPIHDYGALLCAFQQLAISCPQFRTTTIVTAYPGQIRSHPRKRQ